MMRQLCSKLSVAIGLLLTGFSSCSAQTIYGLQQASQFGSKVSGNYYIQIGSYTNQSNALRVKSSLHNTSGRTVLVKEKNSHYQVMVGPFRSAAEVRTAAQELSGRHARPLLTKKMTKSEAKIPHYDRPVIQETPSAGQYKDKDGVAPSNHWFVGLGAGWMQPFGTDTSNFVSSGIPGLPSDRYLSNDTKGTSQLSAFGGYQWRRDAEWLPATSLSLDYTYTFSSHVNGVIFVNNLADAKNFTFKYDISQQIPMAKLKLDLYRWQQWMPYVSAGAGVAFNRVYRYSDAPIPGATLMNRRSGFNSATSSQFAGSLGAGLDYWLNYSSQISLGYELSYYGKARTGYDPVLPGGGRLGSNFNSNAVILKGTYFFK